MDLGDQAANLSLNESNSKKRTDALAWQEYYMATAVLASLRSKDPDFQVGACVVNTDGRIIGVGYNGLPLGCSDDIFPWGKDTANPLENKHYYVCHAELNAIVNKEGISARDGTIYVTLFPCNECVKLIIQSGIKEVFYLYEKTGEKAEIVYAAGKRMLKAAGVKPTKLIPSKNRVEISFSMDDAKLNPKKK